MRLEALPDTLTCVKCSTEKARTNVDVDSSDPADMVRMVMTPGGEK